MTKPDTSTIERLRDKLCEQRQNLARHDDECNQIIISVLDKIIDAIGEIVREND